MSELQTEQLQHEPPIEETIIPADTPDDEPISVDLTEGKVVDADAAPEEQPVTKPKGSKPPRSNARIQKLTHDLDGATTYAQRLEQELQAARAETARERQQREQASYTALEHNKARLELSKQDAQAALSAAISAGDTDKQAAATARLSQVTSELTDVESVLTSNPKPSAPPPPQDLRQQQQQPRQPAQQQQPQLPPPIAEFVQSNSWFNPQHPDYDAEMHDEAVLFARQLERKIARGDAQIKVNSPEYFDEISNHVATQFGDEEPEPQPQTRRTPPMSQSRQPVAPAQRSGVPGQNGGKPGGNKVVLTAEEKAFAKNMRDNSAPGFVYPRGHAQAGKPLTDNDLYVKFAREKVKDQSIQAQNRPQQ